jgi:hypothetical protein
VWKRRFDEVIPDRDFLEGRVENVANLGLFVLRRTLMLQAEPRPDRLSILIGINRNLASGLLNSTR